jgi:hypothetical protein
MPLLRCNLENGEFDERIGIISFYNGSYVYMECTFLVKLKLLPQDHEGFKINDISI